MIVLYLVELYLNYELINKQSSFRYTCKHRQPRQTDCLTPIQIWSGIKQSVCLGQRVRVMWFLYMTPSVFVEKVSV